FQQRQLSAMMGGAADGPPAPGPAAPDMAHATLVVVSLLVLVYAWPIAVAGLLRGLKWPQFVRPLALALAAFALRPAYFLVGLVVGALIAGGWAGLGYYLLHVLDPVGLAVVVFTLLLSQAAWRADREFRALERDALKRVPLHRALAGGLSLAGSAAYPAGLGAFLVFSGYVNAVGVPLPPEGEHPL